MPHTLIPYLVAIDFLQHVFAMFVSTYFSWYASSSSSFRPSFQLLWHRFVHEQVTHTLPTYYLCVMHAMSAFTNCRFLHSRPLRFHVALRKQNAPTYICTYTHKHEFICIYFKLRTTAGQQQLNLCL